MAATYTDNGGSVNGSNKVFTYSFPVLQTEDIKVTLNGVAQATTKYTASLSPANITFNNTSIDSAVQESDGSPKTGVAVRVYRETTVGKNTGDEHPKAVFAAGSSIRAGDLNANIEQALFGIHENQEQPIQSSDIQDDAIITSKIKDDAVTLAKLNSGALPTDITVNGDNIVNDAVDSQHYAADSIDQEHYAPNSIYNEAVHPSAEIEVSKLKDGAPRQLLQTDSGGSGVEWTNNVDVPGTLDVTGAATLDSTLVVTGVSTHNNNVNVGGVLDVTGSTVLNGTLATGATNVTGNITVSGTVDGRDVATDGSKLDGIDAGAKDDQTAAEIRTLVESASDSNVFTDADHTKLNSVETGATADQTNSEIRTAVEAASDSNVFTDADHSKLNGIEAGATADQTLSDISGLGAATLTGSETLTNKTLTSPVINDMSGTAVVTSGTSTSDTKTYSAKRAGEIFYGKDTAEEIQSGETWSAADDKVATTAAIDARIIDLVDDVGGFVPIANETSFPNANPDVNNGAGTLVSIKALGSNLVSNGSGVATIANGTVGNSTVTINGLANSTTYTAGYGLIVETTTTLNTYTFHRQVPIATEITTVAGSISNVNTVAGDISNVNAVAGNATNINAVAADASDIGAVAGKATEIGRLGTADAVSDMNTLGTNAIVSDMDTLADISANITTVAGISANVTTVAANNSNVTAVAGNNSNITAVAGNATNINAVAADASDIGVVAADGTDIGLVAGSIGNVNTTAGSISNVNTVASNISNVNNFTDKYQIASSNPGTDGGGNALAAGDLYFNTSANELKVYNGSAWQGGVTASGNFASTTGNTFTGNNIYNDNVNIHIGTNSDTSIYHNDTDFYVDNDKGDIKIRANVAGDVGGNIRLMPHDDEDGIKIIHDGNVELYANGTKKLDVTSAGITVTGTVIADNLDVGTDVDVDGTLEADAITVNGTALNEYIADTVGDMVTSNTESGITVAYDDNDNTLDFTITTQTDNNFTTALKNKLDGIEASATADQSNAEIRAAVEAASDSNVFTDDDHSKLNAIEASATADQTASEIRTLVESASDSNVFTDADHSKLNAIEASATADQTASEIKTLLNADGIVNAQIDGSAAIAGTKISPNFGSQNIVTSGTVDGRDVSSDGAKLDGIESGAKDDQTAAEIKTLLNSNGIVNAQVDGSAAIAGSKIDPDFGSQTVETTGGASIGQNIVVGGTVDGRDVASDGSKLDGIESGATADQSAAEILTAIKTVDGSGSGLDADTVDGLNPVTGDGANRIVRTDGNGYMWGNYINMNGTFATSANSSGMGRFTGTNGSDTYGRSYTAAAARSLLNVADGATNVTNNNQLTNGAGYVTSAGATSFSGLSDYATGNWTPVPNWGSGHSGGYGYYVRTGNVVHCWGYLDDLDDNNSAAMRINGLPYNASGTVATGAVMTEYNGDSDQNLACFINNGTSYFYVYKSDSGGWSALTYHDQGGSNTWYWYLTYRI